MDYLIIPNEEIKRFLIDVVHAIALDDTHSAVESINNFISEKLCKEFV